MYLLRVSPSLCLLVGRLCVIVWDRVRTCPGLVWACPSVLSNVVCRLG